MKLMIRWLLLMIITVALAACDGAEIQEDPAYDYIDIEEQRLMLDVLWQIVDENRNAALPMPYDGLTAALDSFKTPDLDENTDAAIAERIRRYAEQDMAIPAHLSHQDIIYEIGFLFDLLRYSYGAYQYFGGDEVFLPLRDSMLAQAAQMPNPIGLTDYVVFLAASLHSVILDNHFQLFDEKSSALHRIGTRSQLWMNEDYVIRKIDGEFVVDIDGIAYRVLADEILPTLTRDGEFAWAFGYVGYGLHWDAARTDWDIAARLENVETGEVRNIYMTLLPITDANVSHNNIFAVTERGGITILENRRLWEGDNDSQTLQEFANTGRDLRDEPILILDLRGHSGGNDGIAFEWMRQYTGQAPSYGMLFRHLRLNSQTVNALNPWVEAASPPSWQNINFGDGHGFIPNENLVIVLTDNAIGSAGDTFVGYLRQLENVMIVGTNTRGTLITGNVGSAVLPYSRARIGFGMSLNIRPDLSQFEGIGFAPDLWVSPNDALDRVLRFIERYKEIQ